MRFPQNQSNAPVLPQSYTRKKKISGSIAEEEEPAFPFFFVSVAHFARRDFQFNNEVFYSKERFLTTTSELMYEKRSGSSEAD